MYYLYKHEPLKSSLLNTQISVVQYTFWQKQKYIKKIAMKKKKRMEENFFNSEYKKWIYGLCSFYLLNQRRFFLFLFSIYKQNLH